MRVLVVDNHDSFVYNIVQYLLELGADCVVKDRSDVALQDATDVDGVLLSPGPGHPADAGVCLDLVRDAVRRGTPLLGVCLGHQVIAHVHGAAVGRAPEIVHGRTSEIRHDGAGVFRGLPDPFAATRYHSLAVRPGTVPPDALDVTARTPDGVIMGLRHRTRPVEGVQFHPESVLSEQGHQLLGNWLDTCADLRIHSMARPPAKTSQPRSEKFG
ncbi:aminodeoxychorismate/anthranilate synthase component II [Actinomadura darangshiensis]|uniref:Aminodeoxychorismate/anthranilate synthase component II n=1 Tax=Actinomadura darangshiensis TaxID=705336 RepID=A0A4R5AMI1_9ACTN|nr:gamma-glutamyl-gamma-aminobutyrate hydrolase family protein [Actinomadura darangshiensis]TDD74098.1 aminodeoxychorismate/anthranilate synthase component II [Actinomadura darangshiensis]